MTPPQWTKRALSLLLASLGVFLALCLLTYEPTDVSLLTSTPSAHTAGLCGRFGAWVGFLLRGGFGWASFALPALCFLWARRLWQHRALEGHWISMGLAGVFLLAAVGTLCALPAGTDVARTSRGGLVGFVLFDSGGYYLGTAGTFLTAACVALLAWIVVAGQPILAGQGRGPGILPRLAQRALGLFRRSKPAGAMPNLRAASPQESWHSPEDHRQAAVRKSAAGQAGGRGMEAGIPRWAVGAGQPEASV